MLYLHPNSNKIQKAKKEFYDGTSQLVIKRILKLEDEVGRETITIFRNNVEPYLDEILIGEPKTLVRRNKSIKAFCDFAPDLRSAIKYAFNYDRFISKTKTMYDAYDLAKALDIRTCTYCNRNYTSTVIKRNGQKITRPQFDHFFDKENNPLLALSFYNLIPCCSTCNSTIKGSSPFNLEDFLNPYIDKSTNEIRFSYNLTNKNRHGLEVKVISDEGSKAINTVKAFAIEEIYNSHTGVLLDLLRTKQYFSDEYMEILKNNLLDGVMASKEELYRMVFGTELNSIEFSNRPFSKFKKDILTELGVIK